MRTYTYTVNPRSPSSFKALFAEGTTFTADVPVTLAEATDASNGKPYFPDETSVLAKATAQLQISAVHGADAWVEKEVKAGRTPTAEQVQDKIRGFRYGELRVRGVGGEKAPAAETKAKAKAYDASRQALIAKVLLGRFSKTSLTALVEAESLDREELVAAIAAADAAGTNVPEHVRAFATAE